MFDAGRTGRRGSVRASTTVLALVVLSLAGCASPETSYEHATRARRGGDFKGAEAGYRDVLRREPRHAAVHFHLGNLAGRRGDRALAIAHYRAALDGSLPDPEQMQHVRVVALNNLAYTLAEAGESLDEAEALVRRALELAPDRANFLDTLALVLLKQGRPAEARAALERAVTFAPEDDVILEHEADAYLAVGDSRTARAALEEALATRPASPDRVMHLRERLGVLRHTALPAGLAGGDEEAPQPRIAGAAR